MTVFNHLRGLAMGLAVMAFAALGAASAAHAKEEVFLQEGYALSGYDAVSYFSDSGPVVGDDAYTAEYEGAVYRFASAANRDAFTADPATYAPAYGGYCAFGAAMGFKVPTDPTAYRVVDGVLYLNLNHDVQKRWEKDIPGYIRGADNNWALIRTYAPDELHSVEIDGLTLGPQ